MERKLKKLKKPRGKQKDRNLEESRRIETKKGLNE
jgi:hypothetical protein